MTGKVVGLLIRVGVVGVFLAVGGLLTPGFVDAQSPSVTRSFSALSVSAGGELDVMLTTRGYGRFGFGQVVETLPDGFSYVSSTQPGVFVEGRNVVLSFLDEDETVTYTVTAPAVSGAGSFTGVLKDKDKGEHAIGGDASVTVEAVVDVLAAYDTNRNRSIERPEYQAAVEDYLRDVIDGTAYQEIVELYLRG